MIINGHLWLQLWLVISMMVEFFNIMWFSLITFLRISEVFSKFVCSVFLTLPLIKPVWFETLICEANGYEHIKNSTFFKIKNQLKKQLIRTQIIKISLIKTNKLPNKVKGKFTPLSTKDFGSPFLLSHFLINGHFKEKRIAERIDLNID